MTAWWSSDEEGEALRVKKQSDELTRRTDDVVRRVQRFERETAAAEEVMHGRKHDERR